MRDSGAEPIPVGEQIEFGVNYVAERITEIIEMTRLSRENLDRILVGPRGDRLEAQVAVSPSVDLGLEDSTFHFSRGDEKELLTHLGSLRESLSEWVEAVRREASES